MILTFTGDVMLGRAVNDYLITLKDKSVIWGNILPDLISSDLVFINLECALTSAKVKGIKESPVFFFRSEPQNVEALKAANVSYCCCANNHILDFGKEGLLETLKILDQARIKHSGAGNKKIDAKMPADIEMRGIKFRVFAFSDNEPGWEATLNGPGINYIPIDQNDRRFKDLLKHILISKKEGYFVIVSGHWGPNMVRIPPKHHVEFAHALIDAGVDIFHGHSSHVFQRVEIYNGGIIFYDCGEMIDDYAVDPILRNDESFLYQVVLENKKAIKVVLKPIRIQVTFSKNHKLETKLIKLKGKEAKLVNQKMLELSKDYIPKVRLHDNKIIIDVLI